MRSVYEMHKTKRDSSEPSEWETWQIEQFMNNVQMHIQDGTVWLRCNRSYTFNLSGEEDGRWMAEDLVAEMLLARPWLKKSVEAI